MITISKRKPVLLGGLAWMMMLAPRALPDTVSYSSSFTSDSSPLTQTIELAAFDPALGTLNSAQLGFSDLEDSAFFLIDVYAEVPATVSYTNVGVTQEFTLTGPDNTQLTDTYAEGPVTGTTAVAAGGSILTPGSDGLFTALGGDVQTLSLYEGMGNLDFGLGVGAVVGTGSASIDPSQSSGTTIVFGPTKIGGNAVITYDYTPNIQAVPEPGGIGLAVLAACVLYLFSPKGVSARLFRKTAVRPDPERQPLLRKELSMRFALLLSFVALALKPVAASADTFTFQFSGDTSETGTILANYNSATNSYQVTGITGTGAFGTITGLAPVGTGTFNINYDAQEVASNSLIFNAALLPLNSGDAFVFTTSSGAEVHVQGYEGSSMVNVLVEARGYYGGETLALTPASTPGSFDFQLSGFNSESGTLNTTGDPIDQAFKITGISGTGDYGTITGLLPAGTTFSDLSTSDNLIRYLSPYAPNVTGLSFSLANGELGEFVQQAGSDRYFVYAGNTEGGVFGGELIINDVPEPPSGTLMLIALSTVLILFKFANFQDAPAQIDIPDRGIGGLAPNLITPQTEISFESTLP